MTIKRVYAFIAISIMLVSGCASAPPADSGIWITGISESVTRYYIPATIWQERTNRSVTCRSDMTYIDEPDRPVVCNISFFNKNTVPKEVLSLYFTANDKMYPLNNINTMFTRTEYGEIRVTSVIDLSEILDLFRSDAIVLKAVIDSAEYTFIPNNEFMRYRTLFLEALR